MLNKESYSPIREEPFLRTMQGKLAVISLSAFMLLSAAEIAEVTKPKSQDPFTGYDLSGTPTVVSLPRDKRLVTPKPSPYISNLRDIRHVLPEAVEKALE